MRALTYFALLLYCFSCIPNHAIYATSQNEKVNVALNKKVYGSANWPQCLVDGKYHTTISPNSGSFPMVAVDLENVYNLSQILIYAQNEGTFGNAGLNKPFSVYVWDELISICDMDGLYPWKPVKQNLTFKTKGEKITLDGPITAKYIILLPVIDDQYETYDGIPMGELEAFGQKIRDVPVPKVPEDGTYLPNIVVNTRKALLEGQENLFAHVSFFKYIPNPDYHDTSLGWTYDRTNTMAAVRGKARLVLFSGPAALNRLLNASDYEPLRRNVRKWLTQSDAEAEFVNASGKINDGDILLITRYEKFDVDQIVKRLIGGKNSAVISYLISRTPKDNRVAQVMTKLNISFEHVDTSEGNTHMNVQDLINSTRDVPVDYPFKVALSSWKQFATEELEFKVPNHLIPSPYIQGLVKQVLDKYRDFFTYYAPCDRRPLSNDSEHFLGFYNYNEILLLQRSDKVMVAPGAMRSPGYVHSSLKPLNYTVTFKTGEKRQAFMPMGGYAKPGEAFRFKVLNSSTGNSLSMRINPQIDNLRYKEGSLKRWPIVTLSERFSTTDGFMVSPFGGPITIGMSPNSSITIRFENVYPYPWFDICNPKTYETWEEERVKYRGAPYGMIFGDAMISMIHSGALNRMDKETIRFATMHYNNMVRIIHNYRGTNADKDVSEVFVTDDELKAGYGHSGMPWMGYRDWGDRYGDLPFLKAGKNIGYPHEVGHNLQVHRATFINGGEVTNNLYIPVVNKYLLGLDSYGKGAQPGWTSEDEKILMETWKNKKYVGVQVSYYNYFGRMFSPALVGNVLSLATATNEPLKKEVERVNFWIKHMCQESKHDLVPFHRLWSFPITEETVRICGEFPCVFPDDELTKQVPELVDQILKDYGKTCSRDKPSDVKFKGDLMRGINTTSPQSIFFTR